LVSRHCPDLSASLLRFFVGPAPPRSPNVPNALSSLQVISKEIPADVIYEDDKCLAFRDINPQAPVHFLVIPKARDGLTRLSKAHEGHKDILGHLLYTAQKVAKVSG